MASRTEARKFGSFLLDDTNGITIEDITVKNLTKVSFKERLRTDGANVTRDTRSGIQVGIKGKMSAVEAGIVATRMDNLLQAWNNGEDWLQIYDDRRLQCRLSRVQNYELIRGSAGMVHKW